MTEQRIGLIVPLVEEFRVLIKAFPILKVENFDAVDYYSLKSPVSSIAITAIVLGDMGINNASQLTEKLLNQINPTTIILIGIAGAIDRDVKLGDIVVANEISEFLAAAKVIQKDKSYILSYSGNHWKTTFSLSRLATNFEFSHNYLYRSWITKAKSLRKKLNISVTLHHLVNEKPQICIGHIASGDVVGASAAYTVELQGIDRKFLALEMEAAGVAQAACGRAKPVNHMIIRGISDFSDERKHKLDATDNGIWRLYAMYNASNLLIVFLKAKDANITPTTSVTSSNSNLPNKIQSKRSKNRLLPTNLPSFNASEEPTATEVLCEVNLERVTPVYRFGCSSTVNSLSISPVGPFLITASEDHTVQLWSLLNGGALDSFEHKTGVTSVSYSSDGKTFAASTLNHIYIWKLTGAKPFKIFIHHNVHIVQFSPDNKVLASGGGSTEGTIKLWSTTDNSVKQTLYHEYPIFKLAFSPDGKIIAAASKDTDVKIWRVSDGQLLRTLNHKYPVDSIAFSPEGKILGTGSRDNKIRLWRLTGGSAIYTIERQVAPISDIAFSPDGLLGASASEDYTILFWRTSDGYPIKILRIDQATVNCLSFSKDGVLLLSGDNAGTITAWGIR